MKKVVLVSTLVTALGFATMSNAAHAVSLDKDLEQDLIKICKALKSNNKISLRKAVKQSRLTYKDLGEGLVCNGQDAVTFAMLHSADDTAEYMALKANLDVEEVVAKR